jgi:hypothetical protein
LLKNAAKAANKGATARRPKLSRECAARIQGASDGFRGSLEP